MRICAVVALLTGCFNPDYSNTACGPAGECPDGLRCIANVCRAEGVVADARPDGALGGPPTIGFATASSQSDESVPTAQVLVTLSNAYDSEITVPYSAISGADPNPASATDFSLAGTSLVFPPGTTERPIDVTIRNDTTDEDPEGVVLALGAPSAGMLGARVRHTLTIVDEDPAPTIRFAAATSAASEAISPVGVAINLSEASAKPITISFSVTGGTATSPADYTLSSQSPYTFPAGTTQRTINIAVVNDTAVEPDQTVQLTLSSPVNATLGTPSVHVATIVDND